jgi:hypothetical protein
MPPAVMAIVFGLLAAAAAFGIRQGLVKGVAGDGLYHFRRDESPLGFAAVMAGKLFVLGFGIAEILHALKLRGDPMAPLRVLFG